MQLFLGVDGGQTSTTAVIGDETGRVLGSGSGGPCNHVEAPDGRTKFINAITGCLHAACAKAGLDPATVRFESACLGFSGGPADKEAIVHQVLRSRLLNVTTDASVALSGATAGAPGIISIAGTGSIAYGRNSRREFARAGGWGYIYGDEGSGFDIARQAIRAMLRYEEGWGPPTALTEVFLAETGASDANDLLHRFYTPDFPRPKIASFAMLVDQTALQGDQMARNIISSAGQQLANMASAVRTQIFAEGEPAKIAYSGGVFRSEMLLERFRMLLELEEGNHVIPPTYGPGTGALIEAYSAAGLAPLLVDVPTEK